MWHGRGMARKAVEVASAAQVRLGPTAAYETQPAARLDAFSTVGWQRAVHLSLRSL